jgi:outer membrane protein assembly factor BamB
VSALHSRRRILSALGAVVVESGLAAETSASASDAPTGTPSTPTTGTDGSETSTGPASTPSTETDASAAGGTDREARSPIGSYPTVGVTPARTGYAEKEPRPRGPVARHWCVGTSVANRRAGIAIVDGTVVSGTPEGFEALDAGNGERRWRMDIDAGPPTVRDGRVYLGSHRAVSCHGFESGRELWTRRLSAVTGDPLVFDADGQGAQVFVAAERADDDGNTVGVTLHALEPATGETAYRVPAETAPIYGPLAGRGTYVYGGTTRSVVAFDIGARELAWEVDLGEHVHSVAVTDAAVFAGSHTGVVAALDRVTGDERWRVTLSGEDVEVRARPAVTDRTVYVAATDGDLYAFDRDTGAKRWRFDCGQRLDQPPTVVGDEDRTVVVGSDAGTVFSLDAAAGEMRWSHQLRERVNTPPAVVDGVVYVGDSSGRLYALADEDSNPLSASRACRIRTPTPTARAEGDADSDGVPNRRDYAPRDQSVQDREDIREAVGDSSDDGWGDFLAGIGVGAALSLFGIGLGYAIRGRTGGDSDDG